MSTGRRTTLIRLTNQSERTSPAKPEELGLLCTGEDASYHAKGDRDRSMDQCEIRMVNLENLSNRKPTLSHLATILHDFQVFLRTRRNEIYSCLVQAVEVNSRSFSKHNSARPNSD